MEFGSLPTDLKSVFISLDKRLREITDRAVDYYFDDDPLAELKEKGMALIEDINQERVYTIKQGRAWIVRKVQGGEILLANLHPGDFIGQVPFINIDPEPLTTFIYGTPNLSYEETDSDKLMQKFSRASSTFRNIIDNTAAYITATTSMVCEFKKKHLLNPTFKPKG